VTKPHAKYAAHYCSPYVYEKTLSNDIFALQSTSKEEILFRFELSIFGFRLNQ